MGIQQDEAVCYHQGHDEAVMLAIMVDYSSLLTNENFLFSHTHKKHCDCNCCKLQCSTRHC